MFTVLKSVFPRDCVHMLLWRFVHLAFTCILFAKATNGDPATLDGIFENGTCKPFNFTENCANSQQPAASQSMLQGSQTSVRRVCYFTLPYNFTIDNTTAHLCTHIIAGFVKTLENGTLTMVRKKDPEQYQGLIDLKSCNPALKVLVTTGINNHNNRTGSTNFSVLVNTSEGRSDFVNSSVTFLRLYGFDGLDIDWEYPGHYKNNLPTNNASGDKENFALLLKELHEAFTNDSYPDYCGPLLLSVPVAATKQFIDDGYDITNISKYADLVNIMSYNYHLYQKHRNYTRHNSPLFINEEELNSSRLTKKDKDLFATAYVNYTVHYLLKLGLNESKLNVGLPLFGRTFELANESDNGFLAPAKGPGPGDNGLVEYTWVCNFVNQTNTSTVYNEEIVAPYAYNERFWVAFNEERAITAKVNWTVFHGFGGVMTYALNFDDVNNTCGNGSYPIHTLIRDLLLSGDFESTEASQEGKQA